MSPKSTAPEIGLRDHPRGKWSNRAAWVGSGFGRNGLYAAGLVTAILVVLVWVTQTKAQDLPDKALNLTAAERAWLAENPTIKLAIDNNWAPFEFVDETGQYRGMAADFIRLVEQRLGLRFEIDTERPWPKMVEAVKNRELDAFSLVVKTPQREAFVKFTEPYLSFPMVIVTLSDGPFIDGLAVLRNSRVAVVKSYASHDLLLQNHPDLALFEADSVKAGLEAVSQGVAKAFVGNLAVTEHVMRREGITNLKIAGQTPYRFELSMAVRSDWPELVPILQKALDSISPEDQDSIFNRWLPIKFAEEIDYRIVVFVVGFAGFIILITALWNRRLNSEIRKKNDALAALKASEEKYRALFSTSTVGMLLGGLDGRFVEVNDGFLDIVGHDRETLMTLSTWDITPETYRDTQEAVMASLTDTGIYGPFEKEYIHQNGKRVPVMLHGALVHDERGEPMIWTIVHDISEQKKIEDMKNAFISSVSHELRTPLTAIKGAMELIKGGVYGDLAPELANLIDISARNGDRLLELVNDILEIERLLTGQTGVSQQSIPSIQDFLQSCLDENSVYAIGMAVTFTLAPMDEDFAFTADEARLKQVMSNLLSNAAKFSPTGSDIVIAAEKRQDSVHISVRDHGPGIPPDFQGRIFGKFAQAQPGENTGIKGSGLGLYISKSIVERHGGSIGYQSHDDGGTTFYFDLPIDPPDQQPDEG